VINTKIEDERAMYGKKVRVVILAGQSNMEGHAWSQYLANHFDNEMVAKYHSGYDIKISYNNDKFINHSTGQFLRVKVGQGASTKQFGAEVGMAEKISSGNTIATSSLYFIKYTVGGTSLAYNWRSPSSGFVGDCYKELVEYTTAQLEKLLTMNLNPEISAFCFMQGESDAAGDESNLYEKHLTLFIADIRKQFSKYTHPRGLFFIDATISDSPLWINFQAINQAKYNVSQTNETNVLIDTISANLQFHKEPILEPDFAHYDSDGEIKLGHLFAEVLINKGLLN